MTRSPSPISRIVYTAAARSPPVAGQRRRAGGDATAAGRGLAIGAEVVVEAPAEDGVAQLEHFRRFERIGDSGEETLVGRHLKGQGRLGPPSPQRSTTAPVRCTVSQAMPSRSRAASRLPLLPAP